MRAGLVVGTLIFLAWGMPAYAHDIDEVRTELREKGFDQLEFSRTKPPFKLDACRDGERFHLHVDYYGKVIEQTSLGPCDKGKSETPAATPEASPADASNKAGSTIPSPAPPEPPKQSREAETPAKQSPAPELCVRYFPEVGRTVQMQCNQ